MDSTRPLIVYRRLPKEGKGRDAQIEKAVEVLKAEIAAGTKKGN